MALAQASESIDQSEKKNDIKVFFFDRNESFFNHKCFIRKSDTLNSIAINLFSEFFFVAECVHIQAFGAPGSIAEV